MWIPREISARILELCRAFPAVIVTGGRQTGKKSLVRRLFPIEGPWHRIRICDAKWAETPRADSFSAIQKVAALVERAEGISDVEVALLCRGTTSHTVGERRRLVSAFEVDAYLGA